MGLLDFAGPIGSLITAGANIYDANRQMNFQANMADTAHQREVKDLVAAGLNPVLSANHGAPAMPGSMPTMPDFGSTLNSALSLSQAKAQIALIEQQARKANIEGTLLSKNAPLADAQNAILSKVLPGVVNSADDVIDGSKGILDSVTSGMSNSAASFKKLYDNMFSNPSSKSTPAADPTLLSPDTPDVNTGLTQ